MKKAPRLYPTLESIERKRALEFLALSPTEKYDALINLIRITNEVREAGEIIHKHNIKLS
jgi:hypothetical protein